MAKKITRYSEAHPIFSKIIGDDITPFLENVTRPDIFTMSMVLCDIQMQLSSKGMNHDNAPFAEYDVDNYVIHSQCMPSPECIAVTQKIVDCILNCTTAELQAKIAYMFYVVVSAKL